MAEGRRVPATHRAALLTIALPRRISGPTVAVTVAYHGIPKGDALTFGHHGPGVVISSYGLPYSAREWWPCRDTPASKADSADIEITAPGGLTAASNGRLVSRRVNGDGTATTHWSVRYPIYADVISVAISDYASFALAYRGDGGDTVPMPFYVFPEDEAKARVDFSALPAMLAHHVRRFGPYPFAREKYGVAEMAVESFREHQTLPGYGPKFITGDHGNDRILAHELAHQWFGNALSVKSWSDVWLNEGFATYAALLWEEEVKGEAHYLDVMRTHMVPAVYAGRLYVADSGAVDSMFTSVTFFKGAFVLHMLRHVIGETAFFAALRRYVADNLYRTVTTDDFVRACEREYGKPLDWFFREWVYGAGAPAYDMPTWTAQRTGRGYHVTVLIRQTQDAAIFRMPLDIALTTAQGTTRRVVWDSTRVQQSGLDVADSVTTVSIDPDGWVIHASRP
jgi:aminopeptidase N